MLDGQSTFTAIVFYYIWTYSLTQPLRATVKVGGKVPVYSSLCSLSLGLPRNALILAKPRFGDKNIFLGLKFFKKINKFNFLLMKKF